MSNTKSKGSTSVDFYNRYFEYAKVVTPVVVTDEGVYLRDEVPESYGGAQLELDVVNAVFLINSRAELQILEFEMGEVMDKDRKTGGPIRRDGVDIRPATGDSTVVVEQTLVLNEALDEDRALLGAAALAAFKEDVSADPSQILS